MLATGTPAPDFTLPNGPGTEVALADLLSKGPVVVFFYPHAYSSVCTEEFCGVRDDWSAWSEINASVVGISVNTPFVVAQWKQDLGLPFELLSDFNKDISGLRRHVRRVLWPQGRLKAFGVHHRYRRHHHLRLAIRRRWPAT